MTDTLTTATNTMEWLASNPYPGRGVFLGLNQTGDQVIMGCFMMGRSVGSRNRVYGVDGGRVFTEVADPSKPSGDPEMTIYSAMMEDRGCFVVSNGRQTDAVLPAMVGGNKLVSALKNWRPEPDGTSRITAAYTPGHELQFAMASIRKSEGRDSYEVPSFYYPEIPAGFGRLITTYAWDGNPLPPFTGEPLWVLLQGGIEDIAEKYWGLLNEDNRVGLAVKFIPLDGGPSQIVPKNKYTKVS